MEKTSPAAQPKCKHGIQELDPAHRRCSTQHLSPADTAKEHAVLGFPLCQETSGGIKRRCWYSAVKQDLTYRHAVIADARLEALLVSLHKENVCASSAGAPEREEPLEGEMSTRTSRPAAAVQLPGLLGR